MSGSCCKSALTVRSVKEQEEEEQHKQSPSRIAVAEAVQYSAWPWLSLQEIVGGNISLSAALRQP